MQFNLCLIHKQQSDTDTVFHSIVVNVEGDGHDGCFAQLARLVDVFAKIYLNPKKIRGLYSARVTFSFYVKKKKHYIFKWQSEETFSENWKLG